MTYFPWFSLALIAITMAFRVLLFVGILSGQRFLMQDIPTAPRIKVGSLVPMCFEFFNSNMLLKNSARIRLNLEIAYWLSVLHFEVTIELLINNIKLFK